MCLQLLPDPCTKSWLCHTTWLHPLQVLFKCLLYHPYVSHPLHDFVDLLFLSNISCILLTGRISGHYIHGRNQSQYSDTSLQASPSKRACMPAVGHNVCPHVCTELSAGEQCLLHLHAAEMVCLGHSSPALCEPLGVPAAAAPQQFR